MELEVGIKVTRLRRRISVESDDVQSPSSLQSTPTKKRGGRLAAKPQLELIDENTTEAAPKRTRKSTIKDAEPVEEKTLTPSRRSTRIRSNTSIVSEAPVDGEDKGTPSRRSTRIKSNTSIVAESVQNVNSPRAKRAARRTSLAGSDNEAPITPARQTRRTRKDSSSSVDKQGEPNAGKLGSQVNSVILEESESNVKETKMDMSENDSPTIKRKSPRLVGKSGKVINSSIDMDDKKKTEDDQQAITNGPSNEVNSNPELKPNMTNNTTEKQINISISSSNLINEINEAPKKETTNLNKSTSALEAPKTKNKRNRTKSWTTISVEPTNDTHFCSDSEATKKKNKRGSMTSSLSNISGSGDGIMNVSNKIEITNKVGELIKNVSLNSSTTSEKNINKRNDQSITVDTDTSTQDISIFNKSSKLNKSGVELSEAKDLDASRIEKLLNHAPSGPIQSLVYIEDTDSNSSNEKRNDDKIFDNGDQCVPVVDHQLTETKPNLSYEPMDIDETMPDNICLTNIGDNNKSETEKSLLNESQVKENINKSQINSLLSDNNSEKSVDQFKRQSLVDAVDVVEEKDKNTSYRKSSLSQSQSEDITDGIAKTSAEADTSVNKSITKKPKRKSITNVESDDKVNNVSNKSRNKSITDDLVKDNGTDNEYNNKPKLINDSIPDESLNNKSNKSIRKTSISFSANDDNISNKSSNKSTRLSLSSNTNDDTMNKSLNKSKRKSSISAMDTQTLDKTENENKSTLVLSQLKDVSESDINISTNIPKEEKLSKSLNVPNIDSQKESDKKNSSLTYSTSTPLQQKAFKKLGMQINSSIITPNSTSKLEKNSNHKRSKKETSIMSESTDSSENDESDEQTSLAKSKIIDDEAEEASDDYESGDSRDSDEREYEKQNEIIDKGTTLDSEDEEEYSDDSDYEKGSFIVSSDEEDNDLLSGSGDDLSMSAEELSMSAKSKKKYNEKKIKEQKRASREMFAARHKLNESSKRKTNKSQEIKSSSSDSEEDVTVPKKKNRRQRIDSSHDTSLVQSDGDKSLTKKKKKVKRLSESIHEDNVTKEKEVTICEETQADNVDPLSLENVIKKEPKTPQKEFNISTIAVTNIDNVEEVNINENVSLIKSNQTTDPLQMTIVQDGSDDDESISENEEITQNYESILHGLNKTNAKLHKSLNISSDSIKKAKKAKEPIVDELNLTQVKTPKQKKAGTSVTMENEKQEKSPKENNTETIDNQIDNTSEGSSVSIDMKLLFPDDSNDSESIEVKNKIAEPISIEERDSENIDHFIPLKRTEAKTNILENIENPNKSMNESILNVSKKKKNKRNSSQTEEHESTILGDQDNETVNFFIDTIGTHIDECKNDANTSIKTSTKKKKQKNNVSFVNIEDANVDDDSNDAPLEVSYRSKKNKSNQDLSMTEPQEDSQTNSTSTQNQSAIKKKKNKKGMNNSQCDLELSMIESTENEPIHNSSIGSSKKQKRGKESNELEQGNVVQDVEDVGQEKETSKKRKRKTSGNQTIEEVIQDDKEVNTSKLNESSSKKNKKKKRKVSHNDKDDVDVQNEDILTNTQEPEKVPDKNTKKKEYQQTHEVHEETTRKNKKRKERDDDDASKISKVLKQDSFDKVHVPRLPANVLNQLDDKPKIDIFDSKKSSAIATTSFKVEAAKKRRNKPSNYLEESVYLNDDIEDRKAKGSIKNPKVLPFIPTASTSGFGFTTNFKVKTIPQQTQFVAQSSETYNFKNEYLNNKRIKKLGTFEKYKKQRSAKLTKF